VPKVPKTIKTTIDEELDEAEANNLKNATGNRGAGEGQNLKKRQSDTEVDSQNLKKLKREPKSADEGGEAMSALMGGGKVAKRKNNKRPGGEGDSDKGDAMPKKARYSQRGDPTLNQYFPARKTKWDIIQQEAVELEISKEMPNDKKKMDKFIRVEAIRSPGRTTMGVGLHEVLPTSEGFYIAGLDDPEMRSIFAQLQSGLRTSTVLTLMVGKDGKVWAHTGTFVDPTTGATQYTSGQGGAHDVLRDAMRRIEAAGDVETAEHEFYHVLLESIPHGLRILGDTDLIKSKSTPNLLSAKTIPDLAEEVHRGREEVKSHFRSYRSSLPDETRTRTRSPSRERLSLSDPSGGGEYLIGPSRPPEEMPQFPTERMIAHRAGWVSVPLRVRMM
jgi:hypothetical protein